MAWNSTMEIAVDVGDWMGTKANNIWDSTEDARLWIGEKANETWNSATEAVTIAGTWISDNASDAWEKITKASDATGEVVAAYVEDIDKVEVVDYLTKSGEKLVLGEYSEEDPTLLSIGGTLAASVVNLDIGMDIRDIVYDVQHLDSEDVEIPDIALYSK